MRQIYLQKQFYQLSKHPPVKISERANNRLRLVSAWTEMRKQGDTAEEAARVIGISRATLYRWQERLSKTGARGLEESSRRPKHVRQRSWGMDAIEMVKELRELYPRWGKEKIAVLAAREGMKLSVSSTGRILHYLKQRGYLAVEVKKRWFYRKKHHKRPYATRKPKDYDVQQPGDVVQVDSMDLHPFPNIHLKHFTARDMVSRWDVVEVYTKATAFTAKQFLLTLIARMPFPIKAIQVDGGSEFMKEFEQACLELGLKLFVLPPHSPRLNGRVERAHRTHQDEFYAVYDLDYYPPTLNLVLREWERIYNTVRPHRALDNMSPAEYIRAYHPKISPLLSHMY